MIEFTCPGCLSSHAANEAFVGLRARCVMCGAVIRIPGTSGSVAEGTDAPAPPRSRLAAARSRSGAPAKPARPRPTPARPGSIDDDLLDLADFDDTGDELLTVDAPVPSTRTRTRAKAKAASRAPADKASEGNWESEWEGEADPPADASAAPKKRDATALPDPPDRKKQLTRIGVAAAAILCLGAVGYFAFAGEKKPAGQAKLAPEKPAPVTPKEEVKPVAPPVKKSETPPAGPVLAPPPRPAGAPIPLTAARLFAERAENPGDFEGTYAGKRLLIRGTLLRMQGDTLNLSDVRDENSGIICTLSNPASAPKPELQPGQPLTVAGVYAGNLRLAHCEVVKAGCAADEEYKDREIELTGLVARVKPEGDEVERFPTFVLEAPTTDSPLAVQFLFRLSDKEQLSKLRSGQPVTVRGRCGGRSFRAVRFHDCTIVTPATAPAPASVTRVSLDRFFATYEADLLAADRPDPATGPIALGAEQLASAFGQNAALANETYRHRTVQVTGRVLTLHPANHTVVLETGTSQQYQVLAAFTSTRYAALGDEAVLTVRGTCTGVRGAQVRVENAERIDTVAPDTTVSRTTADFLPLQAGRELTYDLLEPAKSRDNAIRRVAIRTAAPDLLEFIPLRSGTFPAATLFGGDTALRPKWAKDLTKQKNAPQVMQHRVNNNVIELREVPPAPAQPSQWWDPVLKLGVKAGEGWSSESPDGRTISYAVVSFGKDAAGRDTLNIHRMAKNPKAANVWEEWTITYVRGVGEVKRVVSWHATNGKGVTVLEKKLVEAEDQPKSDEKKEPLPTGSSVKTP
jgi:hypothetical protein